MNDIQCTLVGNAVTEVRASVTKSGHNVASFRMASTTRRFNRDTARWEDLDTSFVTVSAWRALAVNVAECVKKGQPLIVTGRLKVREYVDAANRPAISVEVEASSVGHDLARGTSVFERVRRDGRVEEPAVREVHEVPLPPEPPLEEEPLEDRAA